jgi:hypothetical protein
MTKRNEIASRAKHSNAASTPTGRNTVALTETPKEVGALLPKGNNLFIEEIIKVYKEIGALKYSIKILEEEKKKEMRKIYMYFPKAGC